MKITFGSFTIFNQGAGEALYDAGGTIERTLQTIRPLRGTSVQTRDRKLKSTELRFSVARPCADAASMLLALFREEQRIPADSSLVIQQDTVSVTIVGNLRSVGFRHIGTRTFHDYTFTGGAPLIVGLPGNPGTGEPEPAEDFTIKNTDGLPILNTDGTPLENPHDS